MKSEPKHLPGFSLIELMFTMAIGSIILILAASLITTAGTNYQRLSETVSSESEARSLIDQLAADLVSATAHPDTLIEKSTALWPIDHLGFLYLQPPEAQNQDSQIGDLCSVTYYLKDLEIGHQTIRCLMRGASDSCETFTALRQKSVTSLFAPRLHLDEPVAFGVISFVARPMTRDEQGQWNDSPQSELQHPEALEIKLVLARRSLIPKLKTPEDWDGTASAKTFLGDPLKPETNQNLKVFYAFLPFGHESKL